MTYWEKLKDPRWQRKRLEIMDRDGFACQECGKEDRTLNVHHVIYKSKVDPWDYPDGLLLTLCEPCHESRHALQNEIMVLMDILDCHQQVRDGLDALRGMRVHGGLECTAWAEAAKHHDLLNEAMERAFTGVHSEFQ